MKPFFILVLINILFTSCATIFNSHTQGITIVTSKPCKIEVDNKAINNSGTYCNIDVKRSSHPLCITTFSDSINKTTVVKPHNSFAYWMNLYPSILWMGFLVDKNKPERYSFPGKIYIDVNHTSTRVLTYPPIDTLLEKYKNIIKFTPFKLFGWSNSAVEFSFEKKYSDYFSTQLMASWLLPENVADPRGDSPSHIKGFRASLEEKFYFKKSAPSGPYLALEVDYMKNEYHDTWNFGVADIYDSTYNNTNYPDTFGVKKQTFSINLKFGHQILINRLTIDFYVGLGLRYKDVEHFDRINPNDEMENTRHPNFYYITNREGKYWTLSLPLNFRIGWLF